jgi:hypothetical protein
MHPLIEVLFSRGESDRSTLVLLRGRFAGVYDTLRERLSSDRVLMEITFSNIRNDLCCFGKKSI